VVFGNGATRAKGKMDAQYALALPFFLKRASPGVQKIVESHHTH
jgi:hypothetical protein